MTQLTTPENIIDIVFDRTIQNLHFKPVEIEAAQWLYCYQVLGSDFMEYVEANQTDFETLISEYIAPVLAFGVVVHCFNRIFTEITDRGINIFQNTGSQQADAETRKELKQEYDRSLQVKIARMVEYCKTQYDNGVAKFALLEINSNFQNYHEVQTFGKTYKVTHI